MLFCQGIKPRLCSRYRSEAQKTVAKRAVGAILQRRHIHRYVEEQNRETSVAARIFKPQQMATANSGLNLKSHQYSLTRTFYIVSYILQKLSFSHYQVKQ